MTDALTKTYLALALEPVHVGARRGRDAERSSRVFATDTARDIDGLPLIPASSIKGCVRALFSADFGVEACDGKGWNCPQPHLCASCAIFGFANYHHGRSSASLVRFSSASLLAVPLRTSTGIVWLSSWSRLSRTGFPVVTPQNDCTCGLAEGVTPGSASAVAELLPAHLKSDMRIIERIHTHSWDGPPDVRDVYAHLAVVSEHVMCSLAQHATGSVTSVAIDSQSGRAKEGALFEIEYINRWSVLSLDVTYVSPVVRGLRHFLNDKDHENPLIPATLGEVSRIIEDALRKLAFFGIGGKRSRGYGRVLLWPLPRRDDDGVLPAVSAGASPRSRVQVMISYSHADKHLARRLAADLQAEMFDVWLDDREVLVGDSIHARVEEGVGRCDYLVALLSPASLSSAWVREEIDAVRVREKESRQVVLLPLVLETVDRATLPPLLRDRRFAVLGRYEEGLQEIVSSIHGHERRRREGGT